MSRVIVRTKMRKSSSGSSEFDEIDPVVAAAIGQYFAESLDSKDAPKQTATTIKPAKRATKKRPTSISPHQAPPMPRQPSRSIPTQSAYRATVATNTTSSPILPRARAKAISYPPSLSQVTLAPGLRASESVERLRSRPRAARPWDPVESTELLKKSPIKGPKLFSVDDIEPATPSGVYVDRKKSPIPDPVVLRWASEIRQQMRKRSSFVRESTPLSASPESPRTSLTSSLQISPPNHPEQARPGTPPLRPSKTATPTRISPRPHSRTTAVRPWAADTIDTQDEELDDFLASTRRGLVSTPMKDLATLLKQAQRTTK